MPGIAPRVLRADEHTLAALHQYLLATARLTRGRGRPPSMRQLFAALGARRRRTRPRLVPIPRA